MNNWLVTILVVLTFILNSTFFSNIILVNILLLLFIKNIKNIRAFLGIKLLLIYFFFMSFLVGMHNEVEPAMVVRFLSLTILLMIYPIKVEFNKRQFNWILISILYVISVQIGAAFGVSFFNDILYNYYPIEDNIWKTANITSSEEIINGLTRRYAGIYYNPNIMGQAIAIAYILIVHKLKELYTLKFFILISTVFFISILITGGRTGMIVYMLVFLYNFKEHLKLKQIFLIILVVVSSLFFIDIVQVFSSRAFDISGTFKTSGSSGTIKLNILMSYLDEIFNGEINILKALFGNMSFDNHFDADIGYIINFFGLVGLVLIIVFFLRTFYNIDKKYRYIYIIFLVSVGATVIMNFRFSILLIVILSYYQFKSLDGKSNLGRTLSTP